MLTITSAFWPAFTFTCGFASARLARLLGMTVSVTGDDGRTTWTGCLAFAIGSLLKGICACERRTRLYVPGGVLAATVTLTFASLAPGAMFACATVRPTGVPTADWPPWLGRSRTCSGCLKSGQLRV